MTTALFFKVTVLVSTALTVFASGLSMSWQDVTTLWRDRRKVLRSLLVMDLLMPLFALLLVAAFDFRPAVRIALVTLSLSPVLPILPRRALKAGYHASYAFGLYTVVAVLAIVFIPAAVALLGLALGFAGFPATGRIAQAVLVGILVPLGIGIAVRAVMSADAERLIGVLKVVAGVLLVVGTIPVLQVALRDAIAMIGNGTVMAFLLFVVGGLVLGELFGGGDLDDHTVLAMSNACRHPGIALVIVGATFPDQKLVVAAVMIYVVVNILVSVPYFQWNRPHHHPRVSIGTRPAVARP